MSVYGPGWAVIDWLIDWLINPLEFFFSIKGHIALDRNLGPGNDTLLMRWDHYGDLYGACPHRQLHTIYGLLNSRVALPTKAYETRSNIVWSYMYDGLCMIIHLTDTWSYTRSCVWWDMLKGMTYCQTSSDFVRHTWIIISVGPCAIGLTPVCKAGGRLCHVHDGLWYDPGATRTATYHMRVEHTNH